MGTTEVSPSEMMGEQSRNAIVIILPCIFAILLLTALATAFLSARRRRLQGDDPNDADQKRRLQNLENHIKAEPFSDWAMKEKGLDDQSSFSMDLCVICLEDFTHTSQVRALGCHHVFHQECVDKWFARWNEYCPLCHKPILPGQIGHRNRRANWNDHPPIAFMV